MHRPGRALKRTACEEAAPSCARLKVCEFGAITYSATTRTVSIDPRRCYGCGICRSRCKPDAIQLAERSSVPTAARLW